jgi:tRNA 2-thiouridine synthesizing protein A
MGCGELVVKLKLKLRNELQPGDILELTATDPGAPEDIPAWCRLTSNTLLSADHPKYYIQTKENS